MDRARMRFASPPFLGHKAAGKAGQAAEKLRTPRWGGFIFAPLAGAVLLLAFIVLPGALLVLLAGYFRQAPWMISAGAAGAGLGLVISCAAWVVLSAGQRREWKRTQERASAAEEQATLLARAYDATLESWARALSIHDGDGEMHARRVAEMAERLARRVGLSEEKVTCLRRGALLHDVGKMTIPDSVLLKPGRLTDEEWEIIRRHPEVGFGLLEHIEYLRPSLDVVLCHHERWDGSGYPRGLKGEEIPIAARIFILVDVWDALRMDQTYRAAWPQNAIKTYIAQQAGTQFDPAIAVVFLEMMSD